MLGNEPGFMQGKRSSCCIINRSHPTITFIYFLFIHSFIHFTTITSKRLLRTPQMALPCRPILTAYTV